MKDIFIRKPAKGEAILYMVLAVWFTIICAVVCMLGFPLWPMFFACTAFFMVGSDPKKLPTIFIGGFTGLCGAVLFVLIYNGLYSTNMVLALIVALFVVLAIILLGSCYLPGIFNSVSYFYWTAATFDMTTTISNFWLYTAILLIGGAIVIGVTLLILQVFMKITAPTAVNTEEVPAESPVTE